MSTWSDLNREGTEMAVVGDLAAARAKLEAAVAAAPPERQAQCLLNLSHVLDLQQEHQQAVDLLDRALPQADGLVRTMVVAARADVLPWLDRGDEAWRDVEDALRGAGPEHEVVLRATRVTLLMVTGRLDEAERDATETAALAVEHAPEYLAHLYGNLALLAEHAGDGHRATQYRIMSENSDAAEAVARAARARAFAIDGAYADAAEEAQAALDLAYAAAPEVAASVHTTLAEVMSGTGDLASATEHLTLARDLCLAMDDTAGAGTAVMSAARLAYLAADADRADALYIEAETLLADDPQRLVGCLAGRAAVAVLRGRAAEALPLLDRAAGPAMSPLEHVALQQVRGSAFEALGEFAHAESCYAEAERTCAAAGWWHVALGMAWWRADALVRRAAAVTGDERRMIAERALDLALPAALASEAVRQRFPHGSLRERWVALASAPAVRSAFLAIRAVEDTALAAAYIDHLAGAVSWQAEGTVALDRADLISLPPPGDQLPYAASGFATDALPAAGFALPPRVRVDPAVPSMLDSWIDVAEERYGFPVRSGLAVASW